MAEEQILAYVQRALEMREDGHTIDLADLCAEHPEVIPAVAAALDMDAELPATLHRDPLVGSILEGRYALEDWIGAGAMGAVYAGTDRSLGREIAVKVLQHGVLASEQRQQRFVREAKVLASLDHPNIVRIFDHGVADRQFHYIVMERLVGASLSAVLEEQAVARSENDWPIWASPGAPIERRDWLSQIAAWGVQLASALGSAHAEGVLHRDVKPSNVMIDGVGNAVLLDFGIATREGEGSLTIGGTTLGTPWYMSPEQAVDPINVTPQVDIYGLCATLYHLATYQPPYDGDYQHVLLKLQRDDPVPPHKLRPELPLDLCAIIEKGMERDPARRYPTAGDLEADLRAFLAHLPVSARPLSALGRRWRRVKARPAGYVAAAVAALAVGGSVWGTWAYSAAEVARQQQDAAEYRRLFATWPPAAAFEGSVETRRLHGEAERQEALSLGARILEVRPGDLYSRMIRCAVALDEGQLQVCVSDLDFMTALVGEKDDYLAALAKRYKSLPADAVGAGALDLDGLPEPTTDVGRFTAGFHLIRIKDYDGADRHLAAAPSSVPARLANLSPLATFALRRRGEDRVRRLQDLGAEALAIEEELGFSTARTMYFRGFAARWTNDLVGARELFAECLDLNENYNVLYNLAEVERKTLRLASARRHYQRAIDLRPWNQNAPLGYALLLATNGELDLAEQVAMKIPAKSRLTKPWQRDYVLGRISSLRLAAALENGEDGGAILATGEERFQRSLALAAGDRVGQRKVARELIILKAIPGIGDDSARFSLEAFSEALLSPLHFKYLAMMISRPDLRIEDRIAISQSLRRAANRAEQLYGDATGAKPVDASAAKNK